MIKPPAPAVRRRRFASAILSASGRKWLKLPMVPAGPWTRSIRPRSLASVALALALALACGAAAAQQRDRSMLRVSQYPLVTDDGQRIANHAVDLPGPIGRLPGVVTIGNRDSRTTLVEFYDLNCPYCRIAAVDVGDMLDTDMDLKLILVPYPVLGPNSVAASRVELAVAKLGTPEQFYEFHRRIYALRGTVDGPRALAVAHQLGFNEAAITALSNSDEVTQTMKGLLFLGNRLGLAATPSFILGGVAILGYPGRNALQALVDAVGSCGKVVC
jgi:protein-disulfide isomerase